MTTIVFENGAKMPLALPRISLKEFAEFCRLNPNLQVERTAKGELVINTPTESLGDSHNAEITAELAIWNRRQAPPGMIFGPSAGFTLPNTAVRSPDHAWISMTRWQALTPAQRSGFAQICPDFVIELMSPSDRMKDAKAKMEEYVANGARLGWLINPKSRIVYIYRANQPIQTLNNPTELSGDPELPGFVLPMHLVF